VRNLGKLSIVALVAVMLISPAIWADEDDGGLTGFAQELEWSISMDYFSKYVWRGQNLQDDGAFQPGASVGYGGFSVSWWGSVDLSDINGENGELTESDWTFDYTADVPGVDWADFSVGYIDYHFPGGLSHTKEFYWGFAFDVFANPSITFFHDLDEADGTYISFDFGHSWDNIFEITEDMPVGMDLSLGFGWGDSDYNTFYWGVDDSAVNDFHVSLGFPIDVYGWTLTPSLNYVTLPSSTLRDTDAYDTASDYFFVGIGLSKSF
jgi:hypothetical protein